MYDIYKHARTHAHTHTERKRRIVGDRLADSHLIGLICSMSKQGNRMNTRWNAATFDAVGCCRCCSGCNIRTTVSAIAAATTEATATCDFHCRLIHYDCKWVKQCVRRAESCVLSGVYTGAHVRRACSMQTYLRT